MAIKDKNEFEVVSVYSPTLKAYHEISVKDLEKELVSFGLDEKEIQKKKEKLVEPNKKRLEALGLEKNVIKKILKL